MAAKGWEQGPFVNRLFQTGAGLFRRWRTHPGYQSRPHFVARRATRH